MLSKKVCIKCLYRWMGDIPIGVGWKANFDREWKEGMIECPILSQKTYLRTESKLPKNCPYAIEHLMENQNVK